MTRNLYEDGATAVERSVLAIELSEAVEQMLAAAPEKWQPSEWCYV